MSFIDRLYYGEIETTDGMHSMRYDSEYKEAKDRMGELKEKLESVLSDCDKALFAELLEEYDHTGSLELRDMFRVGFTVGAGLMSEVNTDKCFQERLLKLLSQTSDNKN